MKLSKYIEISEPFGKNNHRILFSTKTTSKILISDKVYDKLINHKFDKLEKTTINNFLSKQILVENDKDELYDFINESKKYIDNNRRLYEVIQPSANCQLGCSYCGQQHIKHSIDNILIEKITKRINGKLENNTYNHLSIGWFGGEPLLAISNIEDITKQLLKITNKYNISYSASITTNGVNLKKETFRRLVECKISEIDITLDGYKYHHDKRRPIKMSKKSSYDIIINNLLDIVNLKEFEDTRLIIRVNVDNNNFRDIKLLIDDLIDKRLNEKIDNFYLAPIHSWGNDAHKYSLDNELFGKIEIDFMLYLLKNNFKLGILPNQSKKQVCMSLSKEGEVYDAYGNIFNCTEIPYVDVYKKTNYYLSSLRENIKTEERSFSSWYEELLNGIYPCTNCKILPICGGACPKAWKEGNPPCPSIKFNLKERLLIFAKQTFLVTQKR